MPFIAKEKRELVEKDVRLCDEPGDLCYLMYRVFMDAWKKEPRWKTVHALYRQYILDPVSIPVFHQMLQDTKYSKQDIIAALFLAWEVFFAEEVMPYEQKKKAENGAI